MFMTFTVRARVDIDPSIAHLGEKRISDSVSEALRLALGKGEADGFRHKLDDFLAIEILNVTHGQSALVEAAENGRALAEEGE